MEQAREHLELLYADRSPFYGELHDHASTGGRSDGKRCLLHWRCAMEVLGMDFAAILDHRQVRHMYLPLWEDGVFLGGTEPGTRIVDIPVEMNGVHYNMIFEGPHPLEELLEKFPEFEFEGAPNGLFRYPRFERARFCELIDTVKEKGGFFVHPHPKQRLDSPDPLDYWFRDETGIEVFYKDMGNEYTKQNYELWCALLDAGKRVWACAGGDWHNLCNDRALTCIYATAKKNAAYLERLRVGDFVCGAVGIRMAIGDTLMGGIAPFKEQTLSLCVSDFHRSVGIVGHRYRVDLLDDHGVIHSEEISHEEPYYLSLPCPSDSRFLRAEVWDLTRSLRIAIGNPIWNLLSFEKESKQRKL